ERIEHVRRNDERGEAAAAPDHHDISRIHTRHDAARYRHRGRCSKPHRGRHGRSRRHAHGNRAGRLLHTAVLHDRTTLAWWQARSREVRAFTFGYGAVSCAVVHRLCHFSRYSRAARLPRHTFVRNPRFRLATPTSSDPIPPAARRHPPWAGRISLPTSVWKFS